MQWVFTPLSNKKGLSTMKKLLFSLMLAVLAERSEAAQFTVQSFFNPAVTSIIISNNVGVTNLNYIAQNMLQGLYQITTNSAGTAILGSIATNCGALSGTMYTDSVPVVWFGQTYPGTFTVLTNAATAASLNTNEVRYIKMTTNNQFNFFQDVLLPQ